LVSVIDFNVIGTGYAS